MEIAITVEGQRGLTWDKWKAFAPAVEKLGFSGLYRSDHFVDAEPPDLPSLELWVSLAWLADHTQRMRIGSLVTPLSFRHPVHTTRMAKDLNDLSGGRFVLGLGAGWGGADREHNMFGFDLLSTAERFDRFEEGLEVISRLLGESTPVSFDGQYYQLRDAQFITTSDQVDGPTIMVGGNGAKQVLALAAKYAGEWNAIFRTPAQFADLNSKLNMLLEKSQRPKKSIKRSQMIGLIFGVDQSDLDAQLDGTAADEYLDRGMLVGCASQIIDQLGALKEAGVEQAILQWPDLDNLNKLEIFAQEILPKVKQFEDLKEEVVAK